MTSENTPQLDAENTAAHQAATEFADLVSIMDQLRSPGGCPWDAQQTHASLLRYLIEEAYEVVEAIETGSEVNRELLQEELGDVLLQVVFHARIAAETPTSVGGFNITDVVRGLNNKLRRRHPHVFAGESAEIADVEARWDELKKQEKPERVSPFDGIPPHLPALALAEKTISKAHKADIEVGNGEGVGLTFSSEEELGQTLFALVAQAKSQGLDAERALRTYTRQVIAEQD
ncbi:MAG: MazG family protein [Rothia sp. (in: high G+C Gram-positive bacteria)]|nr:MazG family protein [Rothia sp. (in: high G+C Gram-positive bacteria)]